MCATSSAGTVLKRRWRALQLARSSATASLWKTGSLGGSRSCTRRIISPSWLATACCCSLVSSAERHGVPASRVVEDGGVQRALDDEALAAIEAFREKLHHQVIDEEGRKGAAAADGGAAPREPVPPQHDIDVRLPVRGVPKAPQVLGPRAHHGPRSEHRVTSYTNPGSSMLTCTPRRSNAGRRCKSTCPVV